MWAAPLAIAVTMLCGCTDEGSLAITLLMPESEELSPATGDMITELTLQARTADGDLTRLSRNIEDTSAGLDLGRLPEDDGLAISVELRAVGQKLLGFGRSPIAVEIREGKSAEVELNVRKPLAYLPNRGGSLVAIDSSLELGSAVSDSIAISGTPKVTGYSIDGSELFVAAESAAGSSVVIVSTSTHEPSRELASGLPPLASDLVVTADGGYVALAHASDLENVGGVTVIEVASGTATFVELGDIERLAIDATGELFALGSRSPTCLDPALPAAVFQLSLGDVETRSQVPFSGSAGDIAINPQNGALLVADPCAGEVTSILFDSDPGVFHRLTGAAALAAGQDSILVGGIDSTLAMTVVTLSTDGELGTTTELATPMESTVSEDLDTEGQSVRVVATADEHEVLDIAAVPGSESFTVVTRSLYDVIGGGNIPPMTAEVWEYQLINASSASAVQRIRTACELDVRVTFETLINWRCGVASDQLALPAEFRVETVGVLYGDR